jgi:hypothetical protein
MYEIRYVKNKRIETSLDCLYALSFVLSCIKSDREEIKNDPLKNQLDFMFAAVRKAAGELQELDGELSNAATARSVESLLWSYRFADWMEKPS